MGSYRPFHIDGAMVGRIAVISRIKYTFGIVDDGVKYSIPFNILI